MQFALYTLFRAERHVVTQIVKTVFVVGTVSDIRSVRFAFGRCRHARQVDTDGHTEEFKQRTVVFGVTLGEVVVHCHHVNPFAGQGVEVSRQCCGQRFTFTCTHLSDAAFVQHHAADQLDIKVTHTKYTFTGFTYRGERFR